MTVFIIEYENFISYINLIEKYENTAHIVSRKYIEFKINHIYSILSKMQSKTMQLFRSF